ncbi:MAG: glycosyltransferase family 2 protein [bacterium]
MTGLRLGYILPIRSGSTAGDDELTGYLSALSGWLPVIVVDGSDPEIFAERAARWREVVRHVAPDPRWSFANGKVNGVLTGLGFAEAQAVVVADDDVRYDRTGLVRMSELLADVDAVVPQNYFAPAPWHAQWDSARSCLNRLTPHGDFPGTIGLRRAAWMVESGYDGDVLFENLELLRTVQAHGGRVHIARDVFVRRLPPTTRHFLGQRVRQAYDSQAQPLRLAMELAVLPLLVVAATRRPRALPVAAAAVMAGAEAGRRRSGGRTVLPAAATGLAPLWVLERAVCSWVALALRLAFGGVQYSGRRIRVAAHSVRWLRAHRADVRPSADQPACASRRRTA